MKCLIGIIILIMIFGLSILFYAKENYIHRNYTDNPAETCLKYCPNNPDVDCLDICDIWGFSLSSGLRSQCPWFMPQHECHKYERF